MSALQFPVLHPAHGTSRGCVVFLHGGNVANWMWQRQVEDLTDYQVITPDFPGFGARTAESWIGLDHAADEVAELIRTEAEGPVHLVGLSLGAVVALRLLARNPLPVTSAIVSGAAVLGISGVTGAVAGLQLRCWDQPWFWHLQARAFRLPADSYHLYVEHGLSIDSSNARRMLAEVYAGGLPTGLAGYSGRLLALAGSREPRAVIGSLTAIADAAPEGVAATVPGMHHVWNVEDTQLFNEVVRQWINGSMHARLTAVAGSEK
ncbi:alpha/beta hydrolase [Arthrobacter sp. H20]|uniref:alpha/beta fold hydrolase n=1 Tax=Arthrobacter sp. H20 TaxID=1267981 RepID=UPI00047CE852|nr:alpha/beta hydrolase [Arthrobacter sp. H20]